MTGYQSKKAAASAKTIDEVNWLDHEPDGRRAAQEPWRESASDYERGFIDGMQKQAQSSVDKAVNKMAQRLWVGLTEEDFSAINQSCFTKLQAATSAESILKEKNT